MTSLAALPRLTAVEVRKVLDTRSGRALVLLPLALSAAIAAAAVSVQDQGPVSVIDTFVLSAALFNISLPVLAILSFTQEWSTRSSMLTFALTPRRGLVFAAKYVAVTAMSLATLMTAMLLTIAAATAIAGARGLPVAYSVSSGFWSAVVTVLLFVALGAALGGLIGSTAPAVGAFLVLTAFADALLGAVLGPAAAWLRLADAVEAVGTQRFDAPTGPQAAVALLVWIALPLALASVRFGSREAK